MKKTIKLYGEFSKIEPQEDGTLKVAGIASSEAVDAAGEVVKADAMKAAIPDYMAFGAVREMHQAWAAGTALKCEVTEDGKTEFEALIVDSEAIKKVETGVYKGFSIGGKVTAKDPLNKAIITGIRLNEISLVDRPCNPEALLTISKLDDEAPATLGELRKGMWEVSQFASLLASLGWMAQDSAWEAEQEGDGSPVPAALRDWLVEGAAIFQAMAAEEIAELLACLPAPPTVEVLEMAAKLAKGEDLEKAGARFSKATKTALADMHKAVQGVCDKFAAMGYEQAEEDDAEKAVPVEDLQKVEGLESDLQKAHGTIATLEARVKELEAMPEPPKGVIGAPGDIHKGDQEATVEELKKRLNDDLNAMTPEERTRLLLKLAYAGVSL